MAAAASPLFVGHTRFSVHQFGSRYFNATREGDAGAGFSEEEYTAWLYSDERLNPRIEIFTQLSLPQLAQAAEGHNVVHYVSFSPSLPERHKSALKKAATEYEFVELNETTRTVSSTPAKSLIRAAAEKHGLTNGPVGVYRLDDDDVLSVNYFERMAPYVKKSHIGWWVSQGLGLAAIRLGQDLIYAREYYYPKSAFGPLCIAGYDRGEVSHIKAPKHTIMDQTNPTILDSREPAYFHIRHRGQDSTLGGTPTPFYPEAMMRIRSAGPADLKQAAELFPLLAHHARHAPGREEESVKLTSSALTLGDEPAEFAWGRPGSVALRLELPGKNSLKPRQVRVTFATAPVDDSAPSAEEEREFFANAGVHFENGLYSTHVPFQKTGLGHVLPLEPPEGVQINDLALTAEGKPDVEVLEVTAYPL
ncbi:glycosyltransferase [Nesterenkonia populi]